MKLSVWCLQKNNCTHIMGPNAKCWFCETGFTGQTDFIVICYSATTNGLLCSNRFHLKGSAFKVRCIWESMCNIYALILSLFKSAHMYLGNKLVHCVYSFYGTVINILIMESNIFTARRPSFCNRHKELADSRYPPPFPLHIHFLCTWSQMWPHIFQFRTVHSLVNCQIHLLL